MHCHWKRARRMDCRVGVMTELAVIGLEPTDPLVSAIPALCAGLATRPSSVPLLDWLRAHCPADTDPAKLQIVTANIAHWDK